MVLVNSSENRAMNDDEIWRDKLTPQEFHVCREKGHGAAL